MVNSYDLAMENSIKKLNQLSTRSQEAMASFGYVNLSELEQSPSSLDAWDYCFSIAVGMAGATIATSEQLELYLNDIHHAASGATGDYSKLQGFLGSLLHHQKDAIDKLPSQKNFINRAFEPADIGYHRLLWGHDVFDLRDDNPFKLMINQQGVSGILQTVRHLIADTTSKQGLPFPGSSSLDYQNVNGKTSNYLINISKKLSQESVGNMRNAQSIYSHMFTVRAQDILGGGAITGFDALYFKLRGINDSIRKVQFRLISYAVAFFGEAMIGALKQGGVPYINIPLAATVFKNLVQLYYFSIKETQQLHDHTLELINNDDILFDGVLATCDGLVSYDNANGYLNELDRGQKKVDSLIEFFEGEQPKCQ
jgi:hypothetical protein